MDWRVLDTFILILFVFWIGWALKGIIKQAVKEAIEETKE